MSKTIYTFSASTFTRAISGDEFDPWFESTVEYTKDVVLGATAGADSYIDIGAGGAAPLSLRAAFASSAARATLLALLGTAHTLSNTRGRSASALLTKARAIDTGLVGVWYADLVFEQR